MFVPKPATYIQIENISVIKMSRVGGAVSASRTFDITMTLKNGMGEHQFSNINREEQQPLEDFFKAKNIRFKNEMADDASTLIAAALDDDMGSSDDEGGRAPDGSNGEDSESADEDFEASSESDVAEEYDSQHESEGSGSDEEMGDGGDDEDDDGDVDMDEDERPKKKAKSGR
ncbi:FACT complex subunit [Ascosphaera atra]|nr:FACT complex subunit [Ascosphaera atra]KAI5309221.1 FACT complex subunit [Ascosphaera atra]